jgi:flagellar basal-body rod protein FlgG
MYLKYFLPIVCLIFVTQQAHSMMRALNSAASGMSSQEANVNTISNNIANVNTTGFKKERAEFSTLLYHTYKEAGSKTANNTQHNIGVQVGSGSKLSGVSREFTVGSPQLTNHPFDLMIKGDGFFGILLADQSIQYTRDGSFNINNQGVLVNSQGYQVIPVLTFPPNTLTVNISPDGQVDAYIANQVEPTNIGQIPVFTFTNQTGLRGVGGNLYAVTSASGAPINNIPGSSNAGPIMQGALEASNVSIMNEMTNLIRAQRAYEMNSRVMKAADEMLQTVNNIR